MISRIVLSTVLLALAVAAGVHAWVAMPLRPPLGEAAGRRALAFVRASLEGTERPVLLESEAPQQGLPVLLTVYARGLPIARAQGRGASFGAALGEATAALRTQVPASLPLGARIKLDRLIGRGRLARSVAPLFSLGVVPGRDGVAALAGGREAYLTVDDLLRTQAWAQGRLLLIPELSIGLDPQRVLSALGAALALPRRAWPDEVFRFRAEEYVEPASGEASSATASSSPPPQATRARLVEGARAAGAYLMRHLDDRGRFDYTYYPIEDRSNGGGEYSLPRHAGTTSFLAQLYALDQDPLVRAAAERALGYLAEARPPGCRGPRTCVGEEGDAPIDLGSNALGLIALLELERTTHARTYAELREGLADFLLWMQKPNGDFCHLYDPRSAARDELTQLPYFSGEAAYAIALLRAAEPEAVRGRVLELALDRALRYLTEDAYAHLAGQFYIGEDHWTCLAVDAGWEHLPLDHRERYADFCDEVARFFGRTQHTSGDALVAAQPQLLGAYGITAAIAPHLAPVGSRSESLAAIWRLARRRGLPAEDPRRRGPCRQALDGLALLLSRQLVDDRAYLFPQPAAARGGFLLSDVEHEVRIDVVQHAGAAFLGALELL